MGNTIIIGSSVRGVRPVRLGDDAFPVIFANIGMSGTSSSIEEERTKAARALAAGADVISELSLVEDIPDAQRRLMEGVDAPFATVSAYEAYIRAGRQDGKLDAEAVVRIFEDEVLRGFDVVTLHATAFRNDKRLLEASERIIPCTSRGGAMMLELARRNGYENPFYTYFEDILDVAAKYSVCLSLGPCYRPGSVLDSGDDLYFAEMQRMAELAEKARKKGVGVAVEGIGHASIDRIPEIIRKSKAICGGAPYRVLTVSTDIALGYDHVASAIASAVAVMSGACSITCVTRSEHIGLPSADDLEEAVAAARIAAHSGFIARGGDASADRRMSEARQQNGCIGDITCALYPEGAQRMIRARRYGKPGKGCTMCGDYCPFEMGEK